MIDLKHGDCLEIMKTIPDKSIDLVVTDCPYHIVQGGCTNIPRKDEPSGIFNRRNTFTQANAKSGKLFDCNDIEFKDWLPDLYRVLKDNTHCYIMINGRNLKELQVEAEKVGFKFQNILVWNKGNATIAAKQLKRNAIGIELDDKYYEIAKKRIEEDSNKGQMSIFDLN